MAQLPKHLLIEPNMQIFAFINNEYQLIGNVVNCSISYDRDNIKTEINAINRLYSYNYNSKPKDSKIKWIAKKK